MAMSNGNLSSGHLLSDGIILIDGHLLSDGIILIDGNNTDCSLLGL